MAPPEPPKAEGKPLPLVFCGPSGAGKSTLIHKLMSDWPGKFAFCVSSTTREAREGEVEGTDYHFVKREVMEAAIAEGGFVEHAEVRVWYSSVYSAVVQKHRHRGTEAQARSSVVSHLIVMSDWPGNVHGNLYGTSKDAMEAVVASGRSPILDVDLQ
eukprot:1195177-Prorocentrum_minimum.AAC.1